MTLQLPPVTQLDPAQRDVLALPFEQSHLVTGGPGTGKTVTAIYRAAALHRSGRPTVMLMYSKVLSAYTRTAVAQIGTADIATTYHKWMFAFWQEHYRRSPPMLERYEIDWMACLTKIMTEPPAIEQRPYFVVDEGQDMPAAFYLALGALASSVSVFADENQRIGARQSTIREIAAAAKTGDPVVLPRSVRNSRQIRALADRFQPGNDTADTLPDGPTPRLLRVDHTSEAVDHLLLHEKQHPCNITGVILHRARDVFSYHHQLRGRTVNPVQGYVSNTRVEGLSDPAFSGPGIKLITWQSVKGLEFDAVFAPELQHVPGDITSDHVRMGMYVLITRARRDLTLVYRGTGEPALVEALPKELLDLSHYTP
ncbi:Part of AAA domain-containing protein [Micromonospora nigra]|uniref:Part of AAA domain-containing protein n=1 Tax=Micromonospora nigra TaxID=145857 RepID=A0A1C6S902_9ACTN|nr:AAA family ATPase [Micromonospora nigra]SCL25977.1 Part of AAA domain-containing protein [Micromonospora nigra]